MYIHIYIYIYIYIYVYTYELSTIRSLSHSKNALRAALRPVRPLSGRPATTITKTVTAICHTKNCQTKNL